MGSFSIRGLLLLGLGLPFVAIARERVAASSSVEWVWPVLVGFWLIVLVVYVFPSLFVLFSGRSHGGAKFGWFLVTLFFSWLGLGVFLIVTQKAKPPPHSFLNERREPL